MQVPMNIAPCGISLRIWENLARVGPGPERQYRLVYHIFPTTKNRKGTQEPIHGHTFVKHLLGSHFEADSRLRDGKQNKAARFFTRAGRGSGLRRHTLEDDDPSF